MKSAESALPIIQIFNEGIKQYFFPVPNPKGVH